MNRAPTSTMTAISIKVFLAFSQLVANYRFTFGDEGHEYSNLQSSGSLHTIEALSFWAQKEERLYALFEKKAVQLNQEINLISRYLEDYQKSSGKALENLKIEGKPNKESGSVVGSTAILSHRMVTRYVSILSDLRNLLNSTEYREVKGN